MPLKTHIAGVSVVEGKGRGESWNWDSETDGRADYNAPRVLSLVDGVGEEVVEKQVRELFVVVECTLDVSEESEISNKFGRAD